MISIFFKNWKYIALFVLLIAVVFGIKTAIYSTFVDPAVVEVSGKYNDSLSVEREKVKLLSESKLFYKKQVEEDSIFYKKQVEQLQALILQQKKVETVHKKTIEDMKDGIVERCYNCFGKEKPCK